MKYLMAYLLLYLLTSYTDFVPFIHSGPSPQRPRDGGQGLRVAPRMKPFPPFLAGSHVV